MKIKTVQSVSGVVTIEDLRRFVSMVLADILDVVNGRLDFLSNCRTSQVFVSFPAGSATVQVSHTMGIIPNGYIVVGKSGFFDICDGVGTNSNQFIYLQASQAGNATILVY